MKRAENDREKLPSQVLGGLRGSRGTAGRAAHLRHVALGAPDRRLRHLHQRAREGESDAGGAHRQDVLGDPRHDELLRENLENQRK